MSATLEAARGAAGTNAPVADFDHTPGEVVCISLFSVCAVFVLLSAFKAPPDGQKLEESVGERAASSQCRASGSSALVATLAQTLGEVPRVSLGAFCAVLVGLQLAVRAGIMMLFKPAADETSRMSEQTPPICFQRMPLGFVEFLGALPWLSRL